MFDTKTAHQTGASTLSDCVLLTFPKKMHGSLNYAIARRIIEQPLYSGSARWGQADRLVRWGTVVGPTVEGNMKLPDWCCGIDSDEFEGHGLTRFDVEGSRCIVNRVHPVAVV